MHTATAPRTSLRSRLAGKVRRFGPVRSDKLYIFPTRFGGLFILVLLGMLWGSSNYANNLGFVLTFLVGGMAFVSLFHTHAGLKGVTPVAFKAKPVFAGETATFEIGLRADVRERKGIECRLDDGEMAVADLAPDRENRVRATMAAPVRGRLRPRRGLRLSTVWPFGLARSWTWPDFSLEAIVYPAPAQGVVPPESGGHGEGGEGKAGGPGVDDFAEIRPYRHGDPPQRIAWKSSSRGHGLMTKEFQGLGGAATMLDWDRLEPGDVEDKLSRLCAMVLQAHGQNRAYGLSIPGAYIAPDSGEQHKHRCLRALALFGEQS